MEIINKVANSALKTIDLERLYPSGKRVLFDIKNWLFEELILKEKDFRAAVEAHDWTQYQDNFVAVTCTSDAIIPSWALMLVTSKLVPFVKKVVIGDITILETVIFQELIANLPIEEFKDKPIIIKGCSEKPVPIAAYSFLLEKLQPVAKSILFGEACSSVPIYKSKK
ncbi:MAG: DUF2480 family protein [Flavobacteriia bacterium]|nr:DUF2480 family protein [Flavobacteriia bacterium]OIP47861.1 MAG: hypothetical protein AUK46_03485 [Flavobacteriaceae bacterium CG2_30_31_66]PIV97226.1 MAG: hypothetical protein COW43_04175 [Flavobacteriaceae bacterium CG17_big_fil_post_rev_8_21_14_2_50_31_13]PIX15171.1 MAG: hypothetical protein COZ74_00965 [Flavobacteriaceae bacterium CG_4_8_14_3_um_filter_31_8]PIY15900.1 MAG: hypothetical protein COZ16_02465 [Flavobacteriaceae bacterium CG_4_10_14_3_um_filter_31_253]PIZ12295.1 MAG: hypothe